ncbi:bacterio-opsin activator domain-containing protein [Natronorubrum halophilum]|uniref:bacterio-opsin activator domain-containing protein n=1 Tax=Natronorubrum halophilum TaxID=1702106 RepID=UPI0010C188B2|nr:bacterio-opsin activator domain-containing protein [Natronorubrum halophilum]
MSHNNRSESIVHVTTSPSSSLRTRLQKKTEIDVLSVSPEADLETVLETERPSDAESESSDDPGTPSRSTEISPETPAESSSEPLPESEFQRPIAVVLELECPEQTSAILERIRTTAPTVPTIVVPPSGSEALAAAALRANADDYVLTDGDTEPVERIVDTVRSLRESDGDSVGASATVTKSAEPMPTSETAETRLAAETADGKYHRILANELPDEAFVIGADGTYFEAKVRSDVADLYSMSADELVGKRLKRVFPDGVAAELQGCVDRTIQTGKIQSIEYSVETFDGRRRYEARVVPIDERIEGQRAVVWLARDITERAKRERELRSRQDQLETLNRISMVVGQVIDTLVEGPSRNAIEREVCEQLVDSELYCGAWIAERTGEGTLSYRTGAGSTETYLECVREREFDDEWAVQRAVRTGKTQTETGIPENEAVPEPLRESAREDGISSAVSVPISHNESIYGVLVVLSSREEAFSTGERAGFSLLGETIGFTIMAVKNRQLLFSDTVIELEFRIDGGETFSFDLSEEYGCTCSLEWAGTTSGGRTFQYVTVDGLDGETVLEAANAHESIEECRLIHDGENSCTVEMRLSKSGVRTLANHGATIRDVAVENGVGTCLIEVSQDADVREIADALTVVYENTELVARREVDRAVQTAVERRNRMLDQLTDRQLTTLRLAYYGGFFDWPRDSTGEEIAEAMGVSPPTMHQHLRKGLKSILGEFFEAGGGTP